MAIVGGWSGSKDGTSEGSNMPEFNFSQPEKTASQSRELTKAEFEKYNKLDTWSSRFRAMAADGFTTGQISKATGKRYQHVRNVLTKPLKRDAA